MKSVLLASSVSVIALTSAVAADLPAKKAAPAAATENWSCPAFGAGYFKIPGGDNCLRVSGFVRSNNTFNLDSTSRGTAPYTFAGAYRLIFDAKSNSDVGQIGSNIRINDTATAYAFATVGDLTMGQFPSISDYHGHFAYNRANIQELVDTGLTYRFGLGSGNSLTVGVVTAQTTSGSAGTASSRPDLQLGFTTKLADINVDLLAASHEAVASTTGSGSYNGYAVLGRVKLPAGPITLTATGGMASGASRYLTTVTTTLKDTDNDSATASTGSQGTLQAEMAVDKSMVIRGFVFNTSVTGASGSSVFYKRTGVGVNSTITVAKDLTVIPELLVYQTDTGSGSTNTDNLYLRIQRSF